MKTALIAGATGLCGKQLLFSILQNKNYSKVIILVRKEISLKDPKLTQLIFDYSKPESYENIPEGNHVFCCLGTTIKKAGNQDVFREVDYTYPVNIAKACSKKGYSHISILSAIGASTTSSFFYSRVKGEMENTITSIPFESIVICRPSLLLGDRHEFRLGEKIGTFFSRFISIFLYGKYKKYRPIESLTVAKAMINLAKEEKKGINFVESDILEERGGS